MKKNIKKIIASFLLCILASFNVAFASESINAPVQKEPLKDSVEIAKVKFIIPKDSMIKLAFAQKFNANKVAVGDKVNFVLPEDLVAENGKVLLPKGTNFIGIVEKQVKSKSFNRNARAFVIIKQVQLPSGELKDISAKIARKNGELKSPFIANLPKLILEAGVIAGVGMTAAAIVIAYTLASIFSGGIGAIVLLAPVTAATAGLGVIVCTTSKGINYKASAGKIIPFILQNDLEFNI